MMLRMKSTVFVVMVLLLADEVAVNAEGVSPEPSCLYAFERTIA